jgi:hypothetical protein
MLSSNPPKVSQRAEGVYCRWETYPEHSGITDNTFVVERVNGDGSVSTWSCARGTESNVIARFLGLPSEWISPQDL